MDEQNENEGKDKKTQHASYGKASFVIALITTIYYGYLISNMRAAIDPDIEHIFIAFILIFCIPVPIIANLIGIILGVVDYRRKEKNYQYGGLYLTAFY